MENYELEYQQSVKSDRSFFDVSELAEFQHEDQTLNFWMQISSTAAKSVEWIIDERNLCCNETNMNLSFSNTKISQSFFGLFQTTRSPTQKKAESKAS